MKRSIHEAAWWWMSYVSLWVSVVVATVACVPVTIQIVTPGPWWALVIEYPIAVAGVWIALFLVALLAQAVATSLIAQISNRAS